VYLEPHTRISPNADGVDDLTRLHYQVGQEARVTVAFEGQDGARYVWRDAERRVPGQYEAFFSGVVDGRVLPDGSYQVAVEAEPVSGGEAQRETLELTIAEGNSTPVEILNLSVTPRLFTPNRDGIRDEAAISYALSKPVSRVDVHLLGDDGKRYPVPPDDLRDPLAEGGHTHYYDGGVGLRVAPPPDGEYTIVVEAYDLVGAWDRVTGTLELEGGGVPQVEIARHNVEFSTDVLVLGETLFFTTTVTNVGTVPIRTHGPEPGTVYESGENYNNYDEPMEDGAWRIGLDFEGNPVYNGRRYPYRWQVGNDEELTEIDGALYLMPGQDVMVTGGLTLQEMPPREAPGFWIGLIHENIRFVEDFVGTEYITIEGEPDAPTLLGPADGG
jgi:hypothetical protein